VHRQTEGNVEMQLLFGGRLNNWFSVKEVRSAPVNTGNEDAGMVVESLLADKRRVTEGLKEKEENVRLINRFIARTRLDELVEGEDQKALTGLAVAGGEWDRLKEVMELQRRGSISLRVALEADKSQESDSAVISAIHELGLLQFCYERKDILKGDFACPVYRFSVMACIRGDGAFVAESDVTNLIASLQWYCRALIYEGMLRKLDTLMEKRAWKELGKYVKESKYTAFNSLRHVIHLASGIAFSSLGLPQVEWLDDNYHKAVELWWRWTMQVVTQIDLRQWGGFNEARNKGFGRLWLV
jgi:hypothetical protein